MKSRRWAPVPYSDIARPDSAARMIRLNAMSGRCRGPYTVKYRSATTLVAAPRWLA